MYRQKIHVRNPAPEFVRPKEHRSRPHFLEVAKLRARYWFLDRLPHWQQLRANKGRRANTREERERAVRALSEAICHRASLVNGRVWASQDLLAKDAGLTNSRVCRALDDLVQCGYIQVFTVFDLPNKAHRRTVMYVKDEFFQALDFTQREIDGARSAAVDRAVDSEVKAKGQVNSAMLKRAMQKTTDFNRRKHRAEKRAAAAHVEHARERTRLLAELHAEYPTWPVRKLADLADQILRDTWRKQG